jgi:cell division septum initiation protein DivIVA
VYRVFESLDALVTVVEEARGVPMTSNCVVPRGDVLELLDDVREAIPGELDDAQDVLDRRDELVDDATQEAEQTRSSAQADADETLAQAREEAQRLVSEARAEAEQTLAHGRAQYNDLTDRARAEAERLVQAGRVTHDRYITEGQAEQARLISQTEVVHAARHESARIVDAATSETDRLRRECDGYVDAKLAEFEETLSKALGTVTRGRSQLWRGAAPNGAPAGATLHGRTGTGTGMDLID